MTYENLLVSIVVALITAFVTALLSNYYWSRQFKEQEKADYRKLYHRRKLEVYEKIAEYIGLKYNDIYFVTWLTVKHAYTKENMPGWALSKLRDFTTGTGEISRKYIMYISLNVWDSLKELDKFVMDVYDNILNGKKSDEGMTKQFADRVFKLQRLLRNELGIKELLDTMPLPNETLIKMQHEAEIKNEQ